MVPESVLSHAPSESLFVWPPVSAQLCLVCFCPDFYFVFCCCCFFRCLLLLVSACLLCLANGPFTIMLLWGKVCIEVHGNIMFSCFHVTALHQSMHFHVFSPFSAHFPHPNGKWSIISSAFSLQSSLRFGVCLSGICACSCSVDCHWDAFHDTLSNILCSNHSSLFYTHIILHACTYQFSDYCCVLCTVLCA